MAISFDYNSIHCVCGNRVAFFEDYIAIDVNGIEHEILHILESLPGRIFKRVFNVDNVNIHQPEIGNTVAEACCVHCRTKLEWKFIAVSPENMFVREGRFLMKLDKLHVWNELNNEPNADQDGGANQQVVNVQDSGANVGQDGVPTEQDSGANVGQDGGGNQHEQDLGGNNGQSFHQYEEDATEEDGGCCSCVM